jgi:hypothetical protein
VALGLGIVTSVALWLYRDQLQLTDLSIRLQDAEARLASETSTVQRLTHEIDELRARSGLFESLSPDTWELRVVDLGAVVGSTTSIGTCPSEHCLTFLVHDMETKNNTPRLLWHISGRWSPFLNMTGKLVIPMPLVRGCAMHMKTAAVDVKVLVMDDRISKARLAFAASPGTAQSGKMQFTLDKCTAP